MADDPIVFIDSGVGGLPYLKMARIYMPGENFVYVADNKNFPYGEKNARMLKEIILELIQDIVDKISPKLVVIACNTASVVALSMLREKFGIPFVGVVPAIKPAGKYAVNGTIGLLATRKTVTDPYTDGLITQFASTCRVEKFAGIDLVDFVENKYFSSTEEEKMEVVLQASEYFNNLEIDALVLGCTHFVYLKDYFKKNIAKSVDIIDSVEGVCHQISRIIEGESTDFEKKPENTLKGNRIDMFFITGDSFDQSKYLEFAREFDLEWGGSL